MAEEEYKMNNANMAFALGQMQSARESLHFDGSYIVEIDGELHTLSELVDFWKEKHEESRKQRKGKVSENKGVEGVQKKTDTGKGSDLSVLREEDKASALPSRRRKRGKLSEPKP